MEENLKIEKLEEILVLNGDRSILVEEFKTTFYTIRRALSGEINTDLSIKIREAAIKLGGELISDNMQDNTSIIKVFECDRKFLKEKHKTTYYTVGKALAGETKTLLGYQIRRSAIDKCGGMVKKLEEINKNTK